MSNSSKLMSFKYIIRHASGQNNVIVITLQLSIKTQPFNVN